MAFFYTRTVRFQDTDAAGVVYFANVLAICHEAYEASLVASGINLKSFFSNSSVAIPIVHAGVDFFRPLFCGDLLTIELIPNQLTGNEFEIAYRVFAGEVTDKCAAQAITRHVCIEPARRSRQPLGKDMVQWLCRWNSSGSATNTETNGNNT